MNNNNFWRRVLIALCLVLITCLSACDKQAPVKPETTPHTYSGSVTTYANNGLRITHPTDWTLLHDEPGIIADRTVAFETPENSRITVFFYESEIRTYADLANSFEQQLRLGSSQDVKNYVREAVTLEHYKGLTLQWTNSGLTETRNEATILQQQAKPYPVLVQFHLFDNDIETQKNNLVPFLKGISLDSHGVNQ